MIGNNTWITDLQVGYKVIEYYKSSGEYLISEVVSIDRNKIGVRRDDNTVVYYNTDGRMIIYPYGTIIPNFYLLQYKYPTNGSPNDPIPLTDMEEVSTLYPDSGNNYNTYVNLTIPEGDYENE